MSQVVHVTELLLSAEPVDVPQSIVLIGVSYPGVFGGVFLDVDLSAPDYAFDCVHYAEVAVAYLSPFVTENVTVMHALFCLVVGVCHEIDELFEPLNDEL
jgi:hypothetical protein